MIVKQTSHTRNVLPACCAVLMFSVLVLIVRSSALSAPSAWQDYSSGFAIGGYDPVAYFTRGRPVPGREGIEHSWGGTYWRFENTGNRDAFAKHPGVYAPQFAGYDALALSNGLTVQGSPTLWAIYRKRVYLFGDKASLMAWQDNRDKITRSARANWATLGENLPGTSENRIASGK